jgi:hypothetical protein
MNSTGIFSRSNFVILLLLFLTFSAVAQHENASYIFTSGSDSLRPGSFSVRLFNNNFVKNNEYFGKFTEGMTFIGSVLQPEITYAFSGKASLTAGWYARYFYGMDKVNKSLPVIRFNYNFMKGGKFIFGQLSGQLNHKLIEPIYSFDNYFEKNPENGLQLLIDKYGAKADIWLDWEHFLMPGDSEQERITGGANIGYDFTGIKHFVLSAKLQGLIHHLGGQVDVSDAPLQTRANIAPGVSLFYSPESKTVTGVTASAWVVQSLDLSPTPTLPYTKGYGIYVNTAVENKWAMIMAGWWHGKYYFSPLGDYLFQSVSEVKQNYKQDNRNLLNLKLLLNHEIAPGVEAGFRFESYQDLNNRQIDFCYGLNILTQVGWGRKARK